MIVQCLVVIVIILLIVDRWKPEKFVKLHKKLGIQWNYYPIIGNALSLIGNNEDLMKTFTKLHTEAWKNKHNVLSGCNSINDADKACTLLKTTLDKSYVHEISKVLSGNGAIFAPVDIWHRRRKILVPTFAPRYVNNFVPIFEAQSKIAADILESKVGKGNVQCFDHFSPYALDSVCETLFGMNIDAQRIPDHPFFSAFKEWHSIFATRLAQPWLHIDGIFKLLPIYNRQKYTVNIIKEFVDKLIQRKKAQLRQKEDSHGAISFLAANRTKTNIKSFLELMIENSNNTDKAYTDEELREETIVLALAGTDTSAVGLSFTVLLLSQHPDIQDKVYKEIHEVLGDSEKPLQFEDLQSLKYTRAVIKESLRLYPPVPFLVRNCDKDVALSSDIILPKDCKVFISVWGIHRKPGHWGKDANEFNPDRFMSGQIPTQNAFLAFSHGARNCVGQQYSMLSMTTTLVTLLRRYRFTPAANLKYDKNNPLRLSFDIMLKHVEQYPVQIEYRDKCKHS